MNLDPRERPLYHVECAARYMGIAVRHLKAWVLGEGTPPLISTPMGGTSLSFHNLVEANFLSALCLIVRGPKLAEVVEGMGKVLGVPRPLLLGLEAGLGEALDEIGSFLPPKGRLALRELLRTRLARVERDERGSPLRFRPPVGAKTRSAWVTLDPRVAFGNPQVGGVETRAIALRYESGEDLDELAEDLGLSKEAVLEALVFEGRGRSI